MSEKEAIKYLEYMKEHIDFNKIGYVYGNEAIETILNIFNDFKTESKIMKKLIVKNGLWETLLNDDEFIKYLDKE